MRRLIAGHGRARLSTAGCRDIAAARRTGAEPARCEPEAGFYGGKVVWSSHRSRLAAIAAASLVAAFAATPAAVAAGATASPAGQQTDAPKRELLVAHDAMRNERIPAGDSSEVQLLFPDQSSLTVARGSDLLINQFVYDAKTGTGNFEATVTRGVLRYVGGAIARQKEVTFAAPGAVVSLRGGIVLIEVKSDAPAGAGAGATTEAVFLSGDRMCVAANRESLCTSKFGTAITSRPGERLSAPAPVGADAIEDLFGRLHSGSAGGRHRPEEYRLG